MYLWKFETDSIPNSFGLILFQNIESLQRAYELISVLPPSSFAVFDCCYLFELLNLVCAYDEVLG